MNEKQEARVGRERERHREREKGRESLARKRTHGEEKEGDEEGRVMAAMVMVSGSIPVKPFSASPASVTVKPRPLRCPTPQTSRILRVARTSSLAASLVDLAVSAGSVQRGLAGRASVAPVTFRIRS